MVVRQINNNQFRKILTGFDVSAVFDRDGDYYQFKAAIETKEAIRDVVGDEEAKVITQLECWWDKYRVSLHELDTQVAEAESVMKGFFGELGYE